MSEKKPQRVAYSYLRYSDPKQGDGDSVRRQTAKARSWCDRNNVVLDVTTYCDPGVSAFRGKHRETGVLAAFLRDVEEERIPRGSVLLIENMDRLSRESPVRGVNLLSGLLLAGISVVTLAPEELELTEDSDLFSLFRGQMSQARGHDESRTKSARITEAWDNRKRMAGAGTAVVTRKLPAWVRAVGGEGKELKHTAPGEVRLELIPNRAAIVKRIFDMATKGRGLAMIVRQLEADKVEPWGRASCWGRAYIHKILHSRAVLGEYQPMKDDEPDGNVITDYFPKIVDEATWEKAQDALAGRTHKAGRIGKKVANLFTGVLRDARTRGKMLIAWQNRGRPPKRERYRVLIPASVIEHQTGGPSFPNDIFEPAMLEYLKEIDPTDITGEEPKSETATLAAELAALDERMKAIEIELAGDDGDVPALARVLRTLDARRQDTLKKLTAARRADENPLAGTWTEARTLLGAAKDEAGRLRLRSLLQAAIPEVWVLVVRLQGRVYCAAQVHFRSGVRRQVLIEYLPAHRGREMKWAAWSSAARPNLSANIDRPDDTTHAPKVDISDAKDAARVETVLLASTGDLRKLADDRATPTDVKIWLDSLEMK